MPLNPRLPQLPSTILYLAIAFHQHGISLPQSSPYPYRAYVRTAAYAAAIAQKRADLFRYSGLPKEGNIARDQSHPHDNRYEEGENESVLVPPACLRWILPQPLSCQILEERCVHSGPGDGSHGLRKLVGQDRLPSFERKLVFLVEGVVFSL